jgi:hypothetical protein
MEQKAFGYGVYLRIYRIRSCEQSIRGGPPTWILGEGLTTPHLKNVASFKAVYSVSDLGSSSETSNGKSTWVLECGMSRAYMNPTSELRSANSGSGLATAGPASIKQLEESWGNRPIPYFRISGRAGSQMR